MSIDIRDVVADDIHAGLVGFQAGYTGEKRTHHDKVLPFFPHLDAAMRVGRVCRSASRSLP